MTRVEIAAEWAPPRDDLHATVRATLPDPGSLPWSDFYVSYRGRDEVAVVVPDTTKADLSDTAVNAVIDSFPTAHRATREVPDGGGI